jgi:hypothetical protein
LSEATFVYFVKRWIKNNKALLFGGKNTVEAKAWLDKHYSDSAKSTD